MYEGVVVSCGLWVRGFVVFFMIGVGVWVSKFGCKVVECVLDFG